MIIKLIQGQFQGSDALDLITQMIHAKIKYHENKIDEFNNEEDIKRREAKIKRLQRELFEARNLILSKKGGIKIDADLNIE